MKAMAVWPRRRQAGVVDHAEPALTSPTGVRFRTLEVGVCGTDAEICSFQGGEPPDGSEYLIAGHEALGQVEEVGSAVARSRLTLPGAAAIGHLAGFRQAWPDAGRGVVTGRHPLADFCPCALERKRIEEVITAGATA